jgi:predicted SAM-dependent methyltransferase
MCNLSFEDSSYDIVIASHVLHHIHDEAAAIANLHRILRPGGLVLIPVPIFSDRTVTYPAPIETQMRAPGLDYFDRCRATFGALRVYQSVDFDAKYQLWIQEDRRTWAAPWELRPCSDGIRHPEYVPVCSRETISY